MNGPVITQNATSPINEKRKVILEKHPAYARQDDHRRPILSRGSPEVNAAQCV